MNNKLLLLDVTVIDYCKRLLNSFSHFLSFLIHSFKKKSVNWAYPVAMIVLGTKNRIMAREAAAIMELTLTGSGRKQQIPQRNTENYFF